MNATVAVNIESLTNEELVTVVRTAPDASPLETLLASRLADLEDEAQDMRNEIAHLKMFAA